MFESAWKSSTPKRALKIARTGIIQKRSKSLPVKQGSSYLVRFLAVPRLRHVIVEEGIHTVGALAWQNCRQLRIVKLPITVVRIDESAFRGCHWLKSITAPGCADFGYKAFANCSSLQYVHANGGVNTFNGMTELGHYLFDACINSAATTILQAVLEPQSLTPVLRREIPAGCFRSRIE